MTRHFFKLIWNRRRTNGLILAELTLCILTLAGTLTYGCYFALNWNAPLGFEWRNAWRLDVALPLSGKVTDEQKATAWAQFHQLQREMAAMEEVVAVSATNICFPYTNGYSGYRNLVEGSARFIPRVFVTHGGLDALGLDLVSGRWFEPGDENQLVEQTIVTRDYGRLLFGDEDPVGKVLPVRSQRDSDISTVVGGEEPGPAERRIVGVVAEYRMRSALRPAYPAEFSLFKMDEGLPPMIFAIRTRPGTTAAFQEDLFRIIRGIAPDWTVEVEPLSQLRARELRGNFIPLSIFIVIGVFLVLMVGLGLVGVLWQAVTRRTEEMGIRRAVGATEQRVRGQILGELMALTTVATVIASVLFLQMPILNVIHWMPWQAYALALAISLVLIYPFVVLCGLYPAWLATRIHPATALQYE
jgi:putative ABC transport system permease protein